MRFYLGHATAEIAQLKEKISELNVTCRKLEEDKHDADMRIREYNRRINSLEKELVETTKKSKPSEKIEDPKALEASIRETKQLFEENETLRDEVSRWLDIFDGEKLFNISQSKCLKLLR
jgi:chromosome segregation ATPase